LNPGYDYVTGTFPDADALAHNLSALSISVAHDATAAGYESDEGYYSDREN
jgi:hypothetical protein